MATFRGIAKSVEPDAKLADAPMLRGRIVAVNGVPAEKVEAAPESRWVLSSDRGLTYADEVPSASTVVEGKWWPKGYAGPPLVSLDVDAAHGLGLKLGDTITVNVLGRNVEARIANLRKIDWESLAINFVMVFSPNTLENAPHRLLTTLELPEGTTPAREGKLIQALAERFPLVTAIKVGDIVDAARDLLEKVMTAIRMTAGVILAIGAFVLAGAVAATHERRKYQAVLYKTLGATRGRIIRAELAEFGLLGLATAVFAVAAGTAMAAALTLVGVRREIRVLGPRRRGNHRHRARARAWPRHRRHLAGAVGQGRALSPRRVTGRRRDKPMTTRRFTGLFRKARLALPGPCTHISGNVCFGANLATE